MRKTKILAFALAVIMVFSMVSVFASAAFEAPTSTGVSSIISDNSGVLYYYVDKTGGTMTGAISTPSWTDGNNAGGKNVITVYDGANGTAGTTIANNNSNTIVVDGKSYSGSQIKNKTNIFQNETDPVTGTSAIAIRKYNAPAYVLNCGLVQGVDYWVTKNGTTFTVVPAGTEGAYKAKVTVIDEGNNCNNRNLQDASDNLSNDFMTHKIILSLNFRWSGETSIDRLIEPCTTTQGFCGQSKVSVNANGVLYADGGSLAVAQLTSDRYYNLQAEYYVIKDKDAETYSVYYDLYLDGFCVAKQLVMKQLKNKTEAQLTTHSEGSYGFRYFVVPGITANANLPDVQKEYIDAIYLRNLYVYKVANTYTNTNLSNSGNTVEGYDLTLGSNLELNYYVNLLPAVAADANAKVVFTIGEEVVAEKKVSEVTPDAKGLYKFTCPVNSTQMATDIKMSIVSGTKAYYIHQNGASSTEYTYKVVDYAKYILESEDAKYASAKPVVKAMLNYGAYAQTYFAEKNGAIAGTLANVGYEFDQVKLDTAVFGEGTATVTGGLTGIKATLVLDTDTKIKIYQGETLLGTSEGITADKLDEDVTITVEGGTVKVSVLTLAGKVPAEKTNFKNLAKALALYSQATEAYKTAQAAQ